MISAKGGLQGWEGVFRGWGGTCGLRDSEGIWAYRAGGFWD